MSSDNNTVKTGLGSSSALITSLCSNVLLNCLKVFNGEKMCSSFNEYSEEIRLLVLLTCFEANNQAQNKVRNILFNLCNKFFRSDLVLILNLAYIFTLLRCIF